jgi:hypothetical protein
MDVREPLLFELLEETATNCIAESDSLLDRLTTDSAQRETLAPPLDGEDDFSLWWVESTAVSGRFVFLPSAS